jgi:hypothetical protein
MSNKVKISIEAPEAPTLLKNFDTITATCVAADIAVRCAICEETTSMNSNDYRAHGVFICDKCKAAVKHMRNTLENEVTTI